VQRVTNNPAGGKIFGLHGLSDNILAGSPAIDIAEISAEPTGRGATVRDLQASGASDNLIRFYVAGQITEQALDLILAGNAELLDNLEHRATIYLCPASSEFGAEQARRDSAAQAVTDSQRPAVVADPETVAVLDDRIERSLAQLLLKKRCSSPEQFTETAAVFGSLLTDSMSFYAASRRHRTARIIEKRKAQNLMIGEEFAVRCPNPKPLRRTKLRLAPDGKTAQMATEAVGVDCGARTGCPHCSPKWRWQQLGRGLFHLGLHDSKGITGKTVWMTSLLFGEKDPTAVRVATKTQIGRKHAAGHVIPSLDASGRESLTVFTSEPIYAERSVEIGISEYVDHADAALSTALQYTTTSLMGTAVLTLETSADADECRDDQSDPIGISGHRDILEPAKPRPKSYRGFHDPRSLSSAVKAKLLQRGYRLNVVRAEQIYKIEHTSGTAMDLDALFGSLREFGLVRTADDLASAKREIAGQRQLADFCDGVELFTERPLVAA
jgi:hypothetical protein